MSIAIKSLAIKMPTQYYTNEMPPYSTIPNLPTYWWRLWGMEGRYLMDKSAGETVESLGLEACKEALSLAGKNAGDIDLILTSTCCVSGWSQNKTLIFPLLSHQLKKDLGCNPSCVTIHVNQACISFLLLLEIASNYLKKGSHKNILICVSESFSSQMDFMDTSSTLFADGSAAAVVGAGEENGNLLSSAFHSDSTHYELATIQWRYPKKSLECCMPGDLRSYFTLREDAPQKMQTFVPVKVPQIVNRALDQVQLTTKDIDFFVFHQPSQMLIKMWAEKLNVEKERFLITVDQYSCLASASIPLTLHEALRQKKIKNTDKVVLAGASTGWGFCAQVWQIENIKFN
jgi:3-oxoacyl-[acyl-carrier-protein] synthase-3